MSRKKRPEGICHICGNHGPLSYEHVPPSSAFNDNRVLEADINRLIGTNSLKAFENPEGRYNQRGAGGYTLCDSCNNNTGDWYARAFVDFTHQGYEYLYYLKTYSTAHVTFRISPLKVIKQILTMFCSACGPDFARKNPKVPKYLLDRQSLEYPGQFVFLSFYDKATSVASRQSGISGRLDLESSKSMIYSEISFPPFNLVLSFTPEPPDSRLCDITRFSNYGLDEKAEISLALVNLPVSTYLPADYRTLDEVRMTNE